MKQIFIMLVGFSLSGKSTLAKKIQEKFPHKFTRIDSDTIHDFLNETYPIFQDDRTIQGKSFELRQKATRAIHKALIETLLQEGYSIILDSCNLTRERRREILDKVKEINKDIITVILEIQISEKKLYKNLQRADQKNLEKGEKPTWVDLYKKIQKDKFEKPQEKEADYFLAYTEENEQDILNNLKKIEEE